MASISEIESLPCHYVKGGTRTIQAGQPILSTIIWWLIHIGIPFIALAIVIVLITLLFIDNTEKRQSRKVSIAELFLSVVILTVFIFF